MSFEFTENMTLALPDVSDKVKILSEAENGKRNKIVTEIAAIHVGLTGNFNMYTEEALGGSITSWVDPFPKPILLNHDELSDPMGRIMAAKMSKEADGTPYIALQAAITSPEAIERVLDERYITGSVGGRSEVAKCSICGTDWAQAEGMKAPCRHVRGKVYEGKLAYFEFAGINWREYSFVNIPGDKKSQLKSLVNGGAEEGDDGWIRAVRVFSMDMNKESILDLQEGVDDPRNILEDMKKIQAAFTYQNIKGTFLTTTAFELSDLLEKENNEKITFIQDDTTITGETVAKDHVVAIEENTNMAKNDEVTEVQEEDILTVAENLRADRASEDSEVSAQEEENSEEEKTEESAEGSATETDSVEDSDEVAEEVEEAPAEDAVAEDASDETKPEAEEASETDSTEEDQSLVGSEEDAVSDAPQESLDEKSEEGLEDPRLEELQNRVDALVAENGKLKQHLHFMLAERVVDAKISVGLIDFENRSAALTEHEGRTPSSLADALKDVAKLAESRPERVKPGNLMNVKAQAVEGEDAALSVDEDESKAPIMSESDRFAFVMSEALMGRKAL